MVCSAAPVLLLAVTLPLVGSPDARASQPGQSQAGGESGQQLDQESGVGESVLVSVYVQLDFSNETWPAALSRTLTLPAALASPSPRTLTGLSLTTECNVNHDGCTYCACLSGYQWNASSHHHPCQTSHNHQPCGCLVFSPTEAGYCQLLRPVPRTLSLHSRTQTPGDTLNLTLLTSHETTNLNWFLWRAGSPGPLPLQPGTRVSLTSSQGQAVLSIFNISHKWAGEYTCCFEAQGFRWELYQVVRVSLQATDVAQLPDQLSISCTTSPGFQLSCCTPGTHSACTASWSPRGGSKGRNTTCPEDFSAVAWNVTKAGHVAEALCPVNRTGMVKRPCGSDGVWGPIHSNCTDTRLQALLHKAQRLQEGQGWPAEEVPEILAQLSEQVVVVSSPSDLLAVLGTMSSLAKVVADARIRLNHSALEALLNTIDKVLDMDNTFLWTSAQAKQPSAGSNLLLAVETLARSLCPEDHPFSFSLANVQLQAELVRPPFPADYSVPFSNQSRLQAQILGHSLAPLGHNRTNNSITSLVLQKLDHLLPSNYGKGLGDSLYATPGLILTVSIMAGDQVFNQGEVIMNFGDIDGTPHCVFWDHNLFQGKGGWSDEGCQVQVASASPSTQCICRHLTAFSILMSRHKVPENPTLDLLGQVGLGASILALLVCLGVYRLVWRVVARNKLAYLRHAALLNVVLCLLAADTCFLGATLLPPGPRSPLCLAAAFLSHFLYLATFFWMLAQSLMLAHQLLFVFHQLSKHRVLSLMVVLGYLCPMGLAGIALGLYLPRGQYLGEEACWLDRKGVRLYTFVGPVLAIVAINGLVLAMAVLKLLRPSLSEGPQEEQRQALLGVIKALLILTPIFGITWGLGLATLLEEVSIVPDYVFTVLNTSQGVFILLFGCLMDKKLRRKDDLIAGILIFQTLAVKGRILVCFFLKFRKK
ncbi:hypothetical protein HPG69_008960 [Diceros bicornis minor]|uniref:Adhesion G protein-coupled receptor F3 n=1 Tax=Diceros bicornis minor TaxID=77932 RepID=A0A7J7EB94_DICBM|nr:hypothetical protein HPG69_008960 [Diceros bicornis minor]